MARYQRFTFLCNHDERQQIAKLASHLRRSQSDAVRFLVVTAVRELATNDQPTKLAAQNESKPLEKQ